MITIDRIDTIISELQKVPEMEQVRIFSTLPDW